MVQLHHKIDYLEELRNKGSIPNSYIAFEVIKEIVAHCENGFENDDAIEALTQNSLILKSKFQLMHYML